MRKENETDKLINDPLLSQALKGKPFLLPEEYFVNLKNEILLKKRISEMGDTSFITPKNYKDDLRQSILSKVAEQNIKSAVNSSEPKLSSQYLEDLQQRILNKTIHLKENSSLKKTANQTPLKRIRKLGGQRWATYAAAASIFLTVGIFAILENKKDVTEINPNNTTVQVESLQTDDIIHYLSYYSEAGDLEYLSEQLDGSESSTEYISTQEIQSYLEYSL